MRNITNNLLFNLDDLKQDGLLDRLLAENAETVARLQKALEEEPTKVLKLDDVELI